MNKWIKIVTGVLVIIVVAVVTVFYLSSGLVDTADNFFKAVKQKEFARARSYLSEDFKVGTDEMALKEFLSKGAIMNFREVAWANRKVTGNRGELDGSITTDNGGVVPMKIMFVKEQGAWKIYAFHKPSAGLSSDDDFLSLPGKAEQVALVKQSIHDFLASVTRKNMEYFRETISQMWQKQITTEQLNEAFISIIKSDSDLSVLESLEPVITSGSKISEIGVLVLKGYYPTEPALHFEMKYIYEGVSWKLIGFSLEAK
ncbi:MAG: hypothetical protein HGA97_07550 [Chlorobiaceae bacterium]|nr:hypothetical protein [Chlorobiaceae bacterium]